MAPAAYAELLQTIDNSTRAKWVHCVETGYDGINTYGTWSWEINDDSPEESWFSLGPAHCYRVTSNGYISLDDYQNRRGYAYNPETNTLTVDYENAELKVHSLAEVTALLLEDVRLREGIVKKTEKIDGRIYLTFYYEDEAGRERWLVDPQTKRLVQSEEIDYEDNEKNVRTYDYPKAGPENIYALGVPPDAKVVNLAPPREIEEAVDDARAAEQNFPKTFFAIECRLLESFDGPVPLERHPDGYMPFQEGTRLYDVNVQESPAAVITVTYRKNYDGRREIYPVWISQYSDSQNYRDQLAQLIATIPLDRLDTLQAWTQEVLPSHIIILNQRNIMHAFQLNRNKTLTLDSDRYDPRDRAALLNINFWRPPNNRYDLDHHYQHLANQSGPWGNLLGIEIGDERYQCYFNPQRDHICEQVSIPSEAPHTQGAGFTKEVLEYAQTSGGRWYPRKTRCIGKDTTYLFVHYVDDCAQIDDRLFDTSAISAVDLAYLRSQ
jgi:hypothetical protein